MVSDHFALKAEEAVDRPMRPDAVSPASWRERLADLRVHPSEVDGDILKLFVPGWEAIDQSKDKSLHDLAGIIAETMSVHAAATELIENEPWDLAAVYYSGIDHFSHRFMRYHAGKARRREPGDTDPALFNGVVANGYRYHDVMLGRLLALAGEDCAVMVLSDHGFHSDRLLPDHIPAEAAGPAVEHRNFGIFCLCGPGVRAGQEIYGASVLDVAPTALHVMGLPAGRDMDGKVMLNAFTGPVDARSIESWEEVEGDAARHPPGEQFDPAEAAESLKQLIALGYVAPPKADARDAVADCLQEQRYNLARAHVDEGRPDLAMPLLRELIAKDREARFYFVLFHCLLSMQDFAGYRRLLVEFDQACQDFSARAIEELKRRRAEKADRDVAPTRVGREDNAARREHYERRQLAEKATGYVTERMFLRCRLILIRGRLPRQREWARGMLEQLARVRKPPLSLRLFLAEAFASLKDYDRALEFLDRVRSADRDNWEALGLAARIHLAARRWDKAVDSAVESLSLVYAQPALHHVLGLALARLGERERAEGALRAAVALAPEYPAAMEALGRLVSRDRSRIGEGSLMMARARELSKQIKERRSKRRVDVAAPGPAQPSEQAPPAFEQTRANPPADRSQVITVVAGLPRSGTSMMMQMLAAAGVPPYTDHKRLADEDNPRGYLEHEKAAALHQDASWIADARGKAVKVVAHLLRFLPPGEQYRVIFMHRDLDEVIASQQVMLKRLKRAGGGLSDERLRNVYMSQLVQVQTLLRRRADIAVLSVTYSDALTDPSATAARLSRFLGPPFDAASAAAAVDPTRRRQSAAKQESSAAD